MQPSELRRVAGRYRLTEIIGRGGMGTVWRAEDELLGRAVAVKVIAAPDAPISSDSPNGLTPETQVQTASRARREARAAGRLNHPGAVTIHDIIEEDGRFHIIMELIRAPTLADLVRAEGPLSPARVAAIGALVLDVLDFAHAEGIVHRDVKPSNVMVLSQDRVKLTDFGIALLRGDPQLTTSGATLGSPLFMAPEQAAGTAVGPAADLWSLGATMYYAVEGRAPFDRPAAMAVLAAILSQTPDPVRLAGPLEPALVALLTRAPESRPDGVVLRRLLSQAALGDSAAAADAESADADDGLAQSPADPEQTLDFATTVEASASPSPAPASPAPANRAPASPATASPATASPATASPATASPVPANPVTIGTAPAGAVAAGLEVPSYGTPEKVRQTPAVTTQDEPAARPSPRDGRREGKVLKALVGGLTVTVAALSFALFQQDSDSNNRSGSDLTTIQQGQGPAAAENAAAETDAAVAPSELAPSAPNAPSDGLGLGSAGRPGLRELEQSKVGPPGQNLARHDGSAVNPVGGYAVGVPMTFETVAVGPTTLIEQHASMFQAGFEVRSYRAVDPWARLVQDEKQFAKEHAADRYERKQLARRWTYRGQPATVWEFTWMLKDELMHAQEVAFRVGPRTYTVLYHSVDTWWNSGGSDAWPDNFERSFFPLS
ncbi:MAG TPA: protein kinase [Kineosporiaceae bacterium]|nr:protein kinase [Kineosporiaceae bacterium]